jgi:hypothetical protein
MDTSNNLRTLNDVFRALAAEDAGLGASAMVEARLRAEVLTLARSRRRSRMAFGALAAGLTLMLAVPLGLLLRQPATNASQQPLDSTRAEQPFLATPYAGSFTGEGQIVRVEVPANTLRAFGVTPSVARGQRNEARVLADILIGEDGVARAIRFVGPVAAEAQR